ncbi:MAG TPA: hypothetical protein VMB77_08080 [Syntrophales bacterium]|nr:hypothetical protein [Syntrophales bacterium]
MMTGEYVAISAAIGTVLLVSVVMFCRLKSAREKRRAAIRVTRQAEGVALIHRLRSYIIP